jgi:hypothetical protein
MSTGSNIASHGSLMHIIRTPLVIQSVLILLWTSIIRLQYEPGWTIEESRFDIRYGQILFSSPQGPYRLWGPSNFVFSGYWELPSQDISGQSVMATTHFHPVLRLRNVLSCSSTSPYVLMARYLIKNRNGYTCCRFQTYSIFVICHQFERQ